MDNTYVRFQKSAQKTIEELGRQKALVASVLDKMVRQLVNDNGFPTGTVWFVEPTIIPPGADKYEIEKAKAVPRESHPRAYGAITRDPYDHGLKVDVILRVVTVDESYVESALPLIARVEGAIVKFTLPKPDKTEVEIATDDVPEVLRDRETALVAGVLRELQRTIAKFLDPTRPQRTMGFHHKDGQPI